MNFHVLNVAENLEAIEKGQAGLPFRKDSDSEEDENVPSPTLSTPLKKDIPSTPQKRVEELVVNDYTGSPLQQYDMDQEYVSHVSCSDVMCLLTSSPPLLPSAASVFHFLWTDSLLSLSLLSLSLSLTAASCSLSLNCLVFFLMCSLSLNCLVFSLMCSLSLSTALCSLSAVLCSLSLSQLPQCFVSLWTVSMLFFAESLNPSSLPLSTITNAWLIWCADVICQMFLD